MLRKVIPIGIIAGAIIIIALMSSSGQKQPSSQQTLQPTIPQQQSSQTGSGQNIDQALQETDAVISDGSNQTEADFKVLDQIDASEDSADSVNSL